MTIAFLPAPFSFPTLDFSIFTKIRYALTRSQHSAALFWLFVEVLKFYSGKFLPFYLAL